MDISYKRISRWSIYIWKVLNIISLQWNASENHQYIPIRRTKMKTIDNSQHWQRYGTTGTFPLLLVGVFIAATTLENYLAVFFKAEHMHTKWASDSTCKCVLSKNGYICSPKKCTKVHGGTIHKLPNVHQQLWVNKLCYICTIKYCTVMRIKDNYK